MQNNILRILFLRPTWASGATFVQRDYDILSKHYKLTSMSYSKDDRLFPARILKHMVKHDLCFVWFGGVHAFWALIAARILEKKIVIVAGGYDAVYMPEIGYGLKYENKGWRRTYFAFKHADIILAFSDSSRESIVSIGKSENVRTLYLGFDSQHFIPSGQKRNIVLTVGHVNWSNVKRKGFETFVRASKEFPGVKFVIAGGHNDDSLEYLKSISSQNIEFTGHLSDEELLKTMQQARVYCQLSAHEGFGCALAEAMLCECIPVVTMRGSIPEVAGEEAFYVPYGDLADTVDKIGLALKLPDGHGFRQRIVSLFPIEKREKVLYQVLDSLLR